MRPGWIFQFGEFQLDVRARSLRREKTIVPLNSRAFDVLLYFVQNPGKVLTREELLKNVWAESFVDENSLAQSISALRRAFEEKPGDNNYIVTLPGRGYQFVSPVPGGCFRGRKYPAGVDNGRQHGFQWAAFPKTHDPDKCHYYY